MHQAHVAEVVDMLLTMHLHPTYGSMRPALRLQLIDAGNTYAGDPLNAKALEAHLTDALLRLVQDVPSAIARHTGATRTQMNGNLAQEGH